MPLEQNILKSHIPEKENLLISILPLFSRVKHNIIHSRFSFLQSRSVSRLIVKDGIC
jgi:hypothetical protein